MSLFLYQLFLWLYRAGIGLAAASGSEKAKRWISGRKGWRQQLKMKAARLPKGRRVWLHAASLGEFEQGRPIMEALKVKDPGTQIILTFFSPSGYEIRKDYGGADLICYLPLDGRRSAADFIDAIRPDAVLFVKYEFWYWYLRTLQRRRIPAALVSAAFRKDQPFFKWYGGLFRTMLRCYDRIFVQDEASARLLGDAGFSAGVTINGDTRYDRVSAIAAAAKRFPQLERFRGSSKLLIAGSSWPADEVLLNVALGALPADWKLVLAPHEIDAAHLQQIEDLFGREAIRYSALAPEGAVSQRVLIIDNIGMLSSLFRYGEIAVIGGGFNKGGIHNVLEPAVFGLPVLFGPVYKKFVEAVTLAERGLAFPVADAAAAASLLKMLCTDDARRQALQEQLRAFVRSQTGATAAVMDWLAGLPKAD